jgi:phosphodiesterase/alkaline phosphatase D-like protein
MQHYDEQYVVTVEACDEVRDGVLSDAPPHPLALELERLLATGTITPAQLPPQLAVAYQRLTAGLLGRRDFLRLASLAALSPALAALLDGERAKAQATLPNRVAAGDTTQTSTVLWARSTQTGALRFDYSTDQTFASGVQSVSANVADATLPVKVVIENLTPGTRYYYRATDAASNSASGTFRTAQPLRNAGGALNRAGFRFGVAGDWRGELAPYPAISNAPGRDLELFVQHGDTIYSDFPSPAVAEKDQAETLGEFRAKHAEVYGARFEANTWGDLRAATSTLATIDDHEVINDFAGGALRASEAARIPLFGSQTGERVSDTPLYSNGLQSFQEYNPLRDEFYGDTSDARTANKRKLYRYRTYGADAAVFVLDTRSFRDAPVAGLTQFTPEAIAAFLARTFTPGRTLLGQAQLAQLQTDLLAAQQAGITWKFVLVPEPIQNLGPAFAQDRYEGYAAERSALLGFIVQNQIRNVVFIAADIHGTVINDVTYQAQPGGPQIATGAFEVTTGSVAFDAPFGPTVVALARQLGLLTQEQVATYNALPTLAAKDAYVTSLVNAQTNLLGYSPVGLENSGIDATLESGGYVAVHTYGWTEFEVEAATQRLQITTYGIPPYTRAQLQANPNEVKARVPAVINRLSVNPVLSQQPGDPPPVDPQNKLHLPLITRSGGSPVE